ncbi:MAG: alpha/beta hydrolase [bacterium]|nr:alpha/beta hydrolase [bacterium]
MKIFVRVLAWIAGGLVALTLGLIVAFNASPWPTVLLIRKVFDDGARAASQALVPYLPSDVVAHLDVPYERDGRSALALDVFLPDAAQRGDRRLLTVVWVHGGAWVSGTKDQNANYSRVLASKGFAVVDVDYTIAPEATYPAPLRQVNAALAFLARHAARYHLDPTRIVLAGDSAGSQIAAQIANIVTDPAYAREIGIVPAIPAADLKGMLLYCGAYDTEHVNLDGSFGGFLKTVLWAYSGTRDYRDNPEFATANLIAYLTPKFPPSFVSAGNVDPLAPQSYAFVEALQKQHVRVDTLFFPSDYQPALSHEYQFDLDRTAGRDALSRSVEFLRGLR